MVHLFDFFLVVLLVWLAGRALADPDHLRAVIQFIVLGLVLSLTWLRLGAPDVALAEAAVGSGLTGALLLWSLRRRNVVLGGNVEPRKEDPSS